MEIEGLDIVSAMRLLVWRCVNAPTYINPHIRRVIPSQDRLCELFSLLGFTFCPGLLDVFQAPTAPSVVWLESLPTEIPHDTWGVYVLILKKGGHPSKVYIGSGTATNGVRVRLCEHRNGKMSPYHVKAALSSGYKITHTALLAHAPFPGARYVREGRAVFLALEAALSCVFWAILRRDKDHGFAIICPWPRDSFEWDGLCSHSPLIEPILGVSDNLAPEELEKIATEGKEKNRKYQQDYGAALRANPTDEYRASRRRINEKARSGTKARQQAAVAEKKYHCSVCNLSCRNGADLRRHNTTPRHNRRATRGDVPFTCELCNMSFKY